MRQDRTAGHFITVGADKCFLLKYKYSGIPNAVINRPSRELITGVLPAAYWLISFQMVLTT